MVLSRGRLSVVRLALGMVSLLGWWMPSGLHAAPAGFVTRSGDQLSIDGQPLRFVSLNIPNLHLVEDSLEFLGESPWRWPDAFETNDALESIRQMEGRVVRCYVLSVKRAESDMGTAVHVLGPGKFNEPAFVALDRVLAAARDKQVRVILPLVDNWKWWGGAAEYAAFRGQSPAAFWTDRQVIDDFRLTVRHIVTRRNTVTGQLYRDDPYLFGWETGNEIAAPPEWTREIAAYIKSLDPNHLVIDGKSLEALPLASLEDPNVDVITTHHYPKNGDELIAAVREAIRATQGRKPYFVGEVGFLPTSDIAQLIDEVEPSHAAGVMLWSLRPHRREGGFYWHAEPMAQGRYKAYHWPGFASGDSYDETNLLTLLRESSFRLQGRPVTPPPPPAAPLLLPATDPPLLAWQGATGADNYRIERSPSATGPWQTVAEHVSDAELPYRPLYCDESMPIDRPQHYRVFARNAQGESPPSNVLGPVVATSRLMVDELLDLSRVAASAGTVNLRNDAARATQEDFHRAELAPGASLEYTLPGQCVSATVFAFASGDEQPVVELLAADSAVLPAETQLATVGTGGGDYGYLRPLRITVGRSPSEVARLRISLPPDARGSVQIARVELRYRPK